MPATDTPLAPDGPEGQNGANFPRMALEWFDRGPNAPGFHIPLPPDRLRAVEPEQVLYRSLAGLHTMKVKVSSIADGLINTYGGYSFSQVTGGEVDPPLGWDGLTHTGSYLCIGEDDRYPPETTP